MSKGRNPWEDGRRAWQRLNGWHQDGPSASPGHPDDGDGALTTLADLGTVRRLLDQAELVAVRTARRHGRSWTEIAIQLGVTRQSAWERWRDLDESPIDDPPVAPGSSRDEVIGRAAGALRRQANVVVPGVVGMTCEDARSLIQRKGLVAVGPDPDGPPLNTFGRDTFGRADRIVIDQSPEAGAKVPTGSPVTLWFEQGGGSGVREPRRPKPKPRAAREFNYEPSDEAVG